MTRPSDPRRRLPSVDRLLAREETKRWLERWGREPVREAIRSALEEARRRLAAGRNEKSGSPSVAEEEILQAAGRALREELGRGLRQVINGTGVVLHTNLGRSPLPDEAIRSVVETAGLYCDLEYEVGPGRRGTRDEHVVRLLRRVTGAPGALVVNNNAAAVALAVAELAPGREVVVSRGELVEIGGSFRLPEVVERSGGVLREVGTTNRTRLSDYREALGGRTGMLLKVHPSNYRIRGFVESVDLADLARLGRERDVPVVHDLGSGLLRPRLLPGFPREPSVRDSLDAGADLVTWSGDKLMGGAQAGLVAGDAELVERARANPLLRAFRVDKMTLAALEAVLRLHLDAERASESIPALRALRAGPDAVEERARRALGSVDAPGGVRIEVASLAGRVGGGAYPGFELPSAGWIVTGVDPEMLDEACRSGDPPLVGRIREGAYVVDFRTILPGQEDAVARVVGRALEGLAGPGSGATATGPGGPPGAENRRTSGSDEE